MELETLPRDILYSILIELPIKEILYFFRLSKKLSKMCNDHYLLADLAKRKYDFPHEIFHRMEGTPYERFKLVDTMQRNRKEYLYAAVKSNDYQLVKYLISLPISWNRMDFPFSYSPECSTLYIITIKSVALFAIMYGYIELAKVLIDVIIKGAPYKLLTNVDRIELMSSIVLIVSSYPCMQINEQEILDYIRENYK
jgi:hypothetical protein